MTPDELHVGAVVQPEWHGEPIRVIAFDEVTVMYDCWWPHLPGWGIDSLNRTITYYRVPTPLLLSRGRLLRTEPYTEVELSVHRPDLPFSFATSTDLEWPMMSPPSRDAFPNAPLHLAGHSFDRPVLDAASIYLAPFGPKGSARPSTLVEAADGTAFTVSDILWHAARLQSGFLRDVRITTGVGIYRAGIRRKIPSYYIWGSSSRMGT